MEFLNDTTLEDFADQDICVIVNSGEDVYMTLPQCRILTIEDKTYIDLVPALNQQFVAEAPENSIFSRTDQFTIAIQLDSAAGQLILGLIEQDNSYLKVIR